MEHLIYKKKGFTEKEYHLEKEFEGVMLQYADEIFGLETVYIDIKKKIGKSIVTIPDGYLIDFTFHKDPKLYIIENELSVHDPYKHIGSQLLKFAISYKDDGRKIKTFILNSLSTTRAKLLKVEKGAKEAGCRNIDDLLDNLIFERDVAAIVVIDNSTEELEKVLSQLTIRTDILEFRSFQCGREIIHKFTPFNAEIREIVSSKTKNAEEIDTIVVPANEEGFRRVFLGKSSWWAIRISANMVDRIKYIAAYQTAPESAITYYAEVASIEKYKETNKYIIYFKNRAMKIGPIKLDTTRKGIAPQSPRYTTFKRLKRAKLLSDIF